MMITVQVTERFYIYLREREACPRTIEKYMRDVRLMVSIAGENIESLEQLIVFKEKLHAENQYPEKLNQQKLSGAMNRKAAAL